MKKNSFLHFVFMLLFLGIGNLNAQIGNVACNTAFGTPWVNGTFSNLAVTSSTGLLGSSRWTNRGNVIDSDTSNKSTARIILGGSRWLRVTDSVNEYPAGTFAGFKIDIADLGTAFTITLKTYNNGTQQETRTINSKLSILNLNGAYQVGIETTKPFDAVQIEYSLIGLTGSIDVYYALLKKFCAGPDLACNTNTKLVNNTYGTYINNVRTGSDGATISSAEDVENVVDSDPANFARLTNLVGMVGEARLSVVDATKVHPAGTFAGFEIENAIITGMNFLNTITVKTYLNGVAQESKTGTTLFVHIPFMDFGNRRIFGIETQKPFNEVQILVNQPAGYTLGTTKVFSLVLTKPCEGPDLVCNTMTKIAKPNFPVNINATKTGVSGIAAVAATVANADNILDADNTNYATMTVPMAAGTNAALSVKKSLTDFPAGIYAGFDVERETLINLNFLNAVSITTYNNGELQETVVGSAQLFSAGSDLIASSGRNTLGFITKKDFDEIRLNISSVASFDIGTTKVYGLVAMKPCPKQINCNSSYYWNQPEFPVVINMQRTGVYNLACAGCTVANTPNVINNNPNDYATINMIAGAGNYGSISVVDPSATYPKGTFAGVTINDKYFPVQFDFKEFTTVKTYLKGVLQESKTSADLFDMSLLIPIWGTGTRNVGFYTTKPFDEIQLVVSSAASFVNRIDVYGVFVDTRSSDGGSISCLAKIVATPDNQTINEGQTGTVSVLANDTINGAAATSSNVNLTQVSTTNAGVQLDPATGLVTVSPTTPMGTYVITYQICDKANPTNCTTTTANITVPNPVIDAIPDNFATIPTNLGGTTASVLTNDTLGGQQATIGNVNVTTGTLPAGITFNPADATFTVAPGTAQGSYPISYTICDKVNPGNCDTAVATVVVGASTIVVDAVNDNLTVAIANGTGGTTTGSVLTNDTVNGATATTGMGGVGANVILTPGTMPSGLTLNPNGTVSVAPGTPLGTYSVPYTICSYVDMSVCDNAVATVVVKGIPDLELKLSASRSVIVIGDNNPIYFTVKNVGTTSTTGTTITLNTGLSSLLGNPDFSITTIPSGWTLVSQSGGNYVFTTNKVLAPGSSDVFVFDYYTESSLLSVTTINGTVQNTDDTITTNNSDAVTLQIRLP